MEAAVDLGAVDPASLIFSAGERTSLPTFGAARRPSGKLTKNYGTSHHFDGPYFP